MIHYPWTRHMQRYEYVQMRGWVAGKDVADIGAGTCAGSLSLSATAKKVYVVDTNDFVEKARNVWVPVSANANPTRVISSKMDLFKFHTKVDVCVAIEVFEHMPVPQLFIDHLATICKNLFLTTPLSMVTTKTRNDRHYAEYSNGDFEAIVGTRFKILERKYQMSDLRIEDTPEFNGDSIDLCHTVQMLWCEAKQ